MYFSPQTIDSVVKGGSCCLIKFSMGELGILIIIIWVTKSVSYNFVSQIQLYNLLFLKIYISKAVETTSNAMALLSWYPPTLKADAAS